MICVSIAEPSLPDCLKVLENQSFAEIRLDAMDISTQDIQTIFGQKKKLIATCRPGRFDEQTRKSLLISAITSGAHFVDIEVETTGNFKSEIVKHAHQKGCRVIMSYHDFHRTPHNDDLKYLINLCFQWQTDIAKIACRVHCRADCMRLLNLIEQDRSIIVIGMGNKGKLTRVAAPLLGSPFTYASLESGKQTASGQLTKSDLEYILKVLS